MLYDSKMTNVVLFIKHINQIVDLYGILTVLK